MINYYDRNDLSNKYFPFVYSNWYSYLLITGLNLLLGNKNEVHIITNKINILEIGGSTDYDKVINNSQKLSFAGVDVNYFTSDIEYSFDLDLVCDAMNIPVKTESVELVILKDSLHHISSLSTFVHELRRILAKKGILVISDPYWGPLAKFIYKNFHPEKFEKINDPFHEVISSKNPEDSNQALLYELLVKKRNLTNIFLSDFEIIEIGPYLGPSYLLSGGKNSPFKLIPDSILIKIFKWESKLPEWIKRLLFLEYIVVLRKL